MSNITAKGLIIKQINYGEADRMLTILTDGFGIIKAAARGVRRSKGKLSASSQFLCYGEFELYKGNSDIASINSVSAIDAFYPISEDIKKLALFTYLCDITIHALQFENPDERVLKLLLNTLHSCAYKNEDILRAKMVYEFRFMSYIGFLPSVTCCTVCGDTKNLSYFHERAGGTICENCRKSFHGGIYISSDMYNTIYYILYALDKRIFAFEIADEVCKQVGQISERYVRAYLEKDFDSLDYFKKMLT